ncbi:MAG: helix-turn-helix transcriptional regulator [Candidatus Omnitrophica bacterium]|nr:hypothetical protein [bacterium]NUN94542.1 helix-turn-helix transcriptional regulator [Candidatus Omnitrophota bacterium]
MDLSKAIRVLMEEKDLSRNDVVQETSWSPAYISDVRNGQADPSARLTEWAEVLGVSASELVIRAESYPDPPRKAVA